MSEERRAPGKAAKTAKRAARIALGIAISALCIFLMFRKVSLVEVGARVARLRWGYFLLALASLAAGYSFRILRWRIMLAPSRPGLQFGACIPPFMASIAMNNVLPLRTGDVLRAFVFPASIGVGRALSLTSLALERALDILVLVSAVAIGVLCTSSYIYPGWVVPSTVTLFVALAVVLLIVAAFGPALARLLRRGEEDSASGLKRQALKIGHGIASALDTSRQIVAPGTGLKLVGASLVAWAFESGVFLCALLAFGMDQVAVYAAIVMAVGTLATIVPSSPGYVGPFHLAVSTLLVLYGLEPSAAAAYAVLVHLSLWIPTTLGGAICLAFNPELFRARRRSAEPQRG